MAIAYPPGNAFLGVGHGGDTHSRMHGRMFNTKVENILAYTGVDPTGATDSAAGIQAALDAAETAGGGKVYAPVGTYKLASTLSIASNVHFFGDGYKTVLLSTVAGTFAHIKNKGFDSSTPASNITVSNLRCRREVALAGSEGPFDGGVELRRVDHAQVHDVRFEGSMTGVHFEGCTNFGWDNIYGWRQGDVCIRINRMAETPSAISTRAGRAVAEDCGFQVLTGVAVPDPLGPVGSGFLNTQDHVNMGDMVAIDCKIQGFEIGGLVVGMSVNSFEGNVRTAGRNSGMLLANFQHMSIGRVSMKVQGSGTATVYVNGDVGAGQVQEDLCIGEISGLDSTGDTAVRDLVSVGAGAVRTSIGHIRSNGMRVFLGGAAGVVDLDIGQITVYNAPTNGIAISNGASRVHVGSAYTYNNGRDTGADATTRAGVYIDGGGTGLRIDRLRSEDLRSGGSRTQNYGVFMNNSDLDCGRTVLTNNVTGDFGSSGTPTFSGDFRGTGTPEGAVQAGVGSTYVNLSGGAGTTKYVKQTGLGNTGWSPL